MFARLETKPLYSMHRITGTWIIVGIQCERPAQLVTIISCVPAQRFVSGVQMFRLPI